MEKKMKKDEAGRNKETGHDVEASEQAVMVVLRVEGKDGAGLGGWGQADWLRPRGAEAVPFFAFLLVR